MSILRPATAFSRLTRRAPPLTSFHPRPFSTTPVRRAQGYGDGEGDPARNNSKPSNSTKESAEHPGPSPPAEGKDTGGGPTQASPEHASAESGGSRSKEAAETGSSPTGGQVGNTGVAASPKIHDNATPSAEGEDYQKEVEQHNREFEKRHDRAPPAEQDKVHKKFWSGQGGADREP